jgi:putative tryptophan/tyrosine transport system substrate-binding protein
MLRPVAARAQQAPMRRVGILWPAASPPAPPRLERFTQALRQLGFTEGHNLAIELRYAQQGLQQIPELAAELARMNVEVVAAFGDLAPKAMQQASKAVPIVAMADDILGAEIVTSLSRPGGNTTGVTVMAPELSQKRLELLSDSSRITACSSPVEPLDRRIASVCHRTRCANIEAGAADT